MSELGNNMRKYKRGQLLLLSVIIAVTCGAYLLIHSSSPSDSADGGENSSLVRSHAKNSTSSRCMPYLKRLRHYCHTSLLEPQTKISQEGHLVHPHTEFESYELVHVHVVTRHGDRTPATALPQIGFPEMHYQCGLSGAVHSKIWAADRVILWDWLNDFPLRTTADSVKNGKLKLHPGSKNESCRIGDLTSQGYLQLHNLGTLMQMMYGKLFAGMDMANDIYVQSTDYRRTIRSASAFLLGFIPNIQKLREMVKIHVQPGNLNQEPPVSIPLTYNPCKTIIKMREAERVKSGYYATEKEMHWMYEKVVNFFKLSAHLKTPWTELFDKFMTRGCHSLHTHSVLPCTKNKSCIDCDLGKKLFDYADWSMSEKYPKNTSLVAVSPFLKHSLLDTMKGIVSMEPTSQSARYKVMLTFTHDSTLNQLMKALGLPVREWVPYASRLSFELWKASDYPDDRVTYFVRVLFNGKIVTHELPFSDSEDKELVGYRKWQKSIVPISVYTYNKLCGI